MEAADIGDAILHHEKALYSPAKREAGYLLGIEPGVPKPSGLGDHREMGMAGTDKREPHAVTPGLSDL